MGCKRLAGGAWFIAVAGAVAALTAPPYATDHACAGFARADRLDREAPAEEPGDEPQEDGPRIRPLTDAEMNRIRFLELRGMRTETGPPDPVGVKLPARVLDEFLTEMQDHEDFRDPGARGAFLKLTAAQKLHYMARHKDKALPLVDRIQITSDPEVFVVFRRHVLPEVMRGCASPGCHSPDGGEGAKFQFLANARRDPAALYANFVILNDLQVNGRPILNRERPAESLLLTYLLPAKDVKREFRHPGSVDFEPLFRSRSQPGFKKIERWIASLKKPAEDYGVRFFHRPADSQPNDAPVDETAREP